LPATASPNFCASNSLRLAASQCGVCSARPGVFCDGLMLGMVTENTLYFRVDDHNRATFKEAESFPPLNYEKQGHTIDLSFWRAPERLFDEPDGLLIWARAALGAARRVATKRERAAPRRKSKPQRASQKS
jgi:DNA transformation protein and related proteins